MRLTQRVVDALSLPKGKAEAIFFDDTLPGFGPGYNYNSDWTPLLARLSPVGMTVSLAAPTPSP